MFIINSCHLLNTYCISDASCTLSLMLAVTLQGQYQCCFFSNGKTEKYLTQTHPSGERQDSGFELTGAETQILSPEAQLVGQGRPDACFYKLSHSLLLCSICGCICATMVELSSFKRPYAWTPKLKIYTSKPFTKRVCQPLP